MRSCGPPKFNMRREDAIRIDHMIEAGEACASFIAGRSRDEFEADLMLRFALARAIEIIGEAASRLSIEARAAAPSIPWREIVAIRNRLIHVLISTSTMTSCGRLRRKRFRRFWSSCARSRQRISPIADSSGDRVPPDHISQKARAAGLSLDPPPSSLEDETCLAEIPEGLPDRAWTSSIPSGRQRPAR